VDSAAVPRATFTRGELGFLAGRRVARMATADARGIPHIIPIVFAMDGRKLYTPLDEKPKRVAPTELKRVRNLLVNPWVAIVVDQYDEDWTKLAWVLVKGRGEMAESGETHAGGRTQWKTDRQGLARNATRHGLSRCNRLDR